MEPRDCSRIFFVIQLFICVSVFAQTKDYFPLNVGNRWIYKCDKFSLPDTISIVNSQRVGDKTYYRLVENTYLSYWLRKDGARVFIVDTSGNSLDVTRIKELLLYDFSAGLNQSWNLTLKDANECVLGGQITLSSKTDTVATPAKKYNNCFLFSREGICRDAGRIKEWFAPGVGRAAFYEESIAGVREYRLISVQLPPIEGIANNNLHANFRLEQNYPNPFNPVTVISYKIQAASNVILKVYDLLGREVAALVDEYKQAGTYSVEFRMQSIEFPSGVYFYTLRGGEYVNTKKMILMK
jgi:hypothetical protein